MVIQGNIQERFNGFFWAYLTSKLKVTNGSVSTSTTGDAPVGTWLYTWHEVNFSSSTPGYENTISPRQGDYNNQLLIEINNRVVRTPTYALIRFRGYVNGQGMYEFYAGDGPDTLYGIATGDIAPGEVGTAEIWSTDGIDEDYTVPVFNPSLSNTILFGTPLGLLKDPYTDNYVATWDCCTVISSSSESISQSISSGSSSTSEGSTSEGSISEGSISEGSISEGSTSEGSTSEGSTSEGSTSEGSTSGLCVTVVTNITCDNGTMVVDKAIICLPPGSTVTYL